MQLVVLNNIATVSAKRRVQFLISKVNMNFTLGIKMYGLRLCLLTCYLMQIELSRFVQFVFSCFPSVFGLYDYHYPFDTEELYSKIPEALLHRHAHGV